MTDAEKLTMLKALVGENDTAQDTALSVYLSLAQSKILSRAYPYDKTKIVVPAQYEVLQCEIAAYLWNKRGAEGQTSHSENGISRSYEDGDVPPSLLREIMPCASVISSSEVTADENNGA